jgi:hypothetical protein
LPLTKIQEEFPEKDVEKIVEGMVKDGLVEIRDERLSIRN